MSFTMRHGQALIVQFVSCVAPSYRLLYQNNFSFPDGPTVMCPTFCGYGST